MAGIEAIRELQTALAEASIRALQGEEWTVAHRSYLQSGGGGFGTNHFERADGSEGSVPSPREVRDLWSRLRAAMADPEAGAWLSAELVVTREGGFEYAFNWDRRPSMNTRTAILDPPEHGAGPSDDDWSVDLRLHPRRPDRTPGWLAAIRDRGEVGEPDGVPPAIDPARVAVRFTALLAEPGWADVVASVARHTVERIRTGDYRWSGATDLPEGDPELDRLLEDVVRDATAEQLASDPPDRLRRVHDGAARACVVPPRDLGAPGDRALIGVVGQLAEALVRRDADGS